MDAEKAKRISSIVVIAGVLGIGFITGWNDFGLGILGAALFGGIEGLIIHGLCSLFFKWRYDININEKAKN